MFFTIYNSVFVFVRDMKDTRDMRDMRDISKIQFCPTKAQRTRRFRLIIISTNYLLLVAFKTVLGIGCLFWAA
jgi:hypothetical protein